jgi:hypothetical protein
MAIARRKPDPDGITTAQLAGTASRYASRKPLDVEAAVAELREIADGGFRDAGRSSPLDGERDPLPGRSGRAREIPGNSSVSGL